MLSNKAYGIGDLETVRKRYPQKFQVEKKLTQVVDINRRKKLTKRQKLSLRRNSERNGNNLSYATQEGCLKVHISLYSDLIKLEKEEKMHVKRDIERRTRKIVNISIYMYIY